MTSKRSLVDFDIQENLSESNGLKIRNAGKMFSFKTMNELTLQRIHG